MSDDKIIPIANASEHAATHRTQLFRMWAGSACNAGLLGREVYVWADHFGDAFEVLVEWLDDNYPSALTSPAEMIELLDEASREVGHESWEAAQTHWKVNGGHEAAGWYCDMLNDLHEIVEAAEADLTIIGHTTLKHGYAIPSHEWGGNEVDAEELREVKVRSVEECLRADLPTIVALLQDVASDCEPDEDSEETPSIDVRLQVSEDGSNWDVHSGDASFDTDHRGYWGASCVSSEEIDGGRAEIIALDLIEQALEHMAESWGRE